MFLLAEKPAKLTTLTMTGVVSAVPVENPKQIGPLVIPEAEERPLK